MVGSGIRKKPIPDPGSGSVTLVSAIYNIFRGTIFTYCFILDHVQVLCGSVLYTWKILTSQLTIQLFEHIRIHN